VASGTPARRKLGVAANFASLAVSSIAGSFLALWATSHLARSLGVVTFGAFNYARTLIDYALIPASFGITVTASRAIARSEDGDPELAGRVVIIRLLASVLGAAGLGLVAFFMRDRLTVVALAAMAWAIPLIALNVDWLYSAHEDQRWPSITRTVVRALYAVIVVTAVSSPLDLRIACFALVLEAGVSAALMWWHARHWIHLSRAVITDVRGMWEHVRRSAHVGSAGLAIRLKTSADLLILGVFGTQAAVGYYSAAYRLVLFVNSLAGLYATVLLPRMSRAVTEGQSREVLGASLRATVLIGAGVSVGGGAIAGAAVVSLMGRSYLPAAGVTQVLMVAAGFIVVSLSLGYTAVALGHERVYGRVTIAVAIANVAINLVVIPLYGMYGAAFTTLATEIALAAILAAVLGSHGLRSALGGSWILRLTLASAATLAAVRIPLAEGAGTWWSAAAGASVFIVCVLLLRLVSRDDWRILSASVVER